MLGKLELIYPRPAYTITGLARHQNCPCNGSDPFPAPQNTTPPIFILLGSQLAYRNNGESTYKVSLVLDGTAGDDIPSVGLGFLWEFPHNVKGDGIFCGMTGYSDGYDDDHLLQLNAEFAEMHGEKREGWVVVREMAEDEDADVFQVCPDEYKLQPNELT